MASNKYNVPPNFFPASVLMWSRPVVDFLEAVARRGFGGAEVWAQHLDRTGESVKSVRRVTRELGLRLSAHAVSYDLNPLSHNREVRLVSRRQVLESLATAAGLEANVVVVHPGHLSSSTDDPEDYWPDLFDLCGQLDERARLFGVRVGIEGMERKVNQFFVEPEALNRLADELAREHLDSVGLTVDLAHLATFTSPVAPLGTIKRAFHVHLSDGDPPSATHRPMGMGRLPLSEMVRAALELRTPAIAIEGRWRANEELALERSARFLSELGESGRGGCKAR